MREVRPPPGRPREEVPGLEERQVEGAPVEGHQLPRLRDRLPHRVEERRLGAEVSQEVLGHGERAGRRPRREADEEHVRAGAAREPRRLGVEEDRAGARRGRAGHRRRHPHRLDRAERRAVGRGHGLERQGLGGRRALGRVARRQPLEAGAEPRQIELAIGDRARRRGPPRSRGECHRRGGARPQPIRRSRSVPAIGFARRPTSFTGPTHDGHPARQAQARIVSRARASSGADQLEEALREADAARLAVIEVDGGLELLRGQEARARALRGEDPRPPRGVAPRLGRGGVAEPGAEVPHVAHEEERRQVMEEVGQPAEAVDERVAVGRDRGQHLGADREPEPRGLHLLLGQLDLARAHVLHRVELDLLEADHLLGDQELALLDPPGARRPPWPRSGTGRAPRPPWPSPRR